MVEHELVLLVRNDSCQLPAVGAARLVWRVLVHDGDVHVVAGKLPHAVEHGHGVLRMPREHEVADDDAAQHPAVLPIGGATAGAHALEHGREGA